MEDKERKVHQKFWYALNESGWLIHHDKVIADHSYDNNTYKKDFLSAMYTSTVFAVVPNSLNINGHFGVSWLEVWYENQDDALYWKELEDMQHAICLAEKNLLLCEIPFCDSKSFHGTKQEIRWKINRNNKIRKKWKLDEIEKELGWGDRDDRV